MSVIVLVRWWSADSGEDEQLRQLAKAVLCNIGWCWILDVVESKQYRTCYWSCSLPLGHGRRSVIYYLDVTIIIVVFVVVFAVIITAICVLKAGSPIKVPAFLNFDVKLDSYFNKTYQNISSFFTAHRIWMPSNLCIVRFFNI